MPTPYNKDFQVYKSNQLQALDCRPTGQTKMVGKDGSTITDSASGVLVEAIEAGECIALVRIPKGAQILAARLGFGSGSSAVIGVGDPFCCGRLLGPILTTGGTMLSALNLNGFDCAVLTKQGSVADGCGLGYTYTCDTDLVLTNGYGENSFGIGGGKTGSANGGPVVGPLASGFSYFFTVTYQVIPNPNA